MSMDFLNSIVDKMEQTKVDLDKVCNAKKDFEKVSKVEPNDIGSWEYRDRCDFELGNIDDLADSIESKGQAQPIVLVLASDIFRAKEKGNYKYIVIAGYRRWLACKSKNITVDAIVRDLNFDQAVACLVSENEKESVSDYSKGMFYYKLLKNERTTKKTLYERLGMKKGVFDNYLSFSEVPQEVWEAVGDLSKVSARTSSSIKLLCQKGDNYKQAVISISKKIAHGIGEKKISSLVNAELSKGIGKNDIKNATRVAFSESIYMDIKKTGISISLKNISNDDFNLLKNKFSEILESFI